MPVGFMKFIGILYYDGVKSTNNEHILIVGFEVKVGIVKDND